jgi:hypothetical protein
MLSQIATNYSKMYTKYDFFFRVNSAEFVETYIHDVHWTDMKPEQFSLEFICVIIRMYRCEFHTI